ncbi:hypothetical protein [Altererythrobacter sp. MTPC7]|uniref:hypothetical protein n=1 Tax=Altererythrobacter sp. MTPC7 TaxID=3056567 RepID=UPI0036F1AFDD
MTRKHVTFLAPALLVVTGLAACGDDSAPAAGGAGGSGAAGDVQGGVISDSMLPLESVTSTSPPRGGEGSASNDEEAGDETTEESAGD